MEYDQTYMLYDNISHEEPLQENLQQGMGLPPQTNTTTESQTASVQQQVRILEQSQLYTNLIIIGILLSKKVLSIQRCQLLYPDKTPTCDVYPIRLTSSLLVLIALVKTKIRPSYSNRATVIQNGYNVEDIILNQGGDKFEEIQYWAVADMTSGDEAKVVSFTLYKWQIEAVKNGQLLGNQIVDNADDVWILPSLRD